MTFNTLHRTILVLFMTTTLGHLFAQVPDVLWKKHIGSTSDDKVFDMIKTDNNESIIVGSSKGTNYDFTVNQGGNDLFISKLDAMGNILWLRSYGGSGSDVARSVAATSDGGYIIAGSTNSSNGDINTVLGGADYWIVKVDSNGYLQWQKSYGGSTDEVPSDIIQSNDGGYIITGYTNSTDGMITGAHGLEDYWTIKIDATGNLLWQTTSGGTSYDYGNSVLQTSDNGYIIAGGTYSNDGDISSSYGNEDCWIVKLNAQGIMEWQKSYGGSSWDGFNEIKLTYDNNYILTGFTESTDGNITDRQGVSVNNTDTWVVKIDTIGNIIWSNSLGGTSSEYGYDIETTSDHGYVMANISYSINGDVSSNQGQGDYWITKLDSLGNLTWQKSLGGNYFDDAVGITQTSSGDYIIAGHSNSTNGDFLGHYGNTNNTDIWLIKFAPFNVDSNITSVLCRNDNTGEIYLTLLGEGAPYSFIWSDGNTSQNRVGLAAGTYSVTITDANQQSIVKSFMVTQPAMVISTSGTTVLVDCFNNSNASITLNTNGGTPAYTYLWNDGSVSPNRTGLSTGFYVVTVTDSQGCTTSEQFNLTQPDLLVASGNVTNPNCNGFLTGVITTNTAGGTLPYVYTWSDGVSTPNRTALGAGNYVLTVTDANNCSVSSSFTITQPASLYSSSNSSAASPGNSDGIAGVITYGGTPPYSYLWETGDTTQRVFNVPGGTYLVTITDALGCVLVDSAIVTIYNGTSQVNDDSHLFQLYPNPTQDLFTLSFTDLSLVQDAQVIIYNSLGQVLCSQALTSDKLMIDLSNQVSGLYWVQLKTKENVILTKPIMKL